MIPWFLKYRVNATSYYWRTFNIFYFTFCKGFWHGAAIEEKIVVLFITCFFRTCIFFSLLPLVPCVTGLQHRGTWQLIVQHGKWGSLSCLQYFPSLSPVLVSQCPERLSPGVALREANSYWSHPVRREECNSCGGDIIIAIPSALTWQDSGSSLSWDSSLSSLSQVHTLQHTRLWVPDVGNYYYPYIPHWINFHKRLTMQSSHPS